MCCRNSTNYRGLESIGGLVLTVKSSSLLNHKFMGDIEMNKRHLKNLAKLADYLENNVKDSQFNMTYMRGDGFGYYCDFKSKTDCGAVGCALGWAPFIIKVKSDDFESFSEDPKSLDFNKYADRVFGTGDDMRNSAQWCYMFDYKWADSPRQSTRKAAVKRIRNLVDSEGKITDKMYLFMKKYSVDYGYSI